MAHLDASFPGGTDGLPRYNVVNAQIPDGAYPKMGQPGGYGGFPGHVTLLHGYHLAGGMFQTEARTGPDGAPGKGGAGGDVSPPNVQLGNELVPTGTFISRRTWENVLEAYGAFYAPGDGPPAQPNLLIPPYAHDNPLDISVARSANGTYSIRDNIVAVAIAAGLQSQYRPKPSATEPIRSSVRLPFARSVLLVQSSFPRGYAWFNVKDNYRVANDLHVYQNAVEGYAPVEPDGDATVRLIVHRATTPPADLYLRGREPAAGETIVGPFPTGYQARASDAYVYVDQRPGTVPLETYWNAQRQDYATVASDSSRQWALQNGYALARVEGYVYADYRPGTRPLRRYNNPLRGDSFTSTALPADLAHYIRPFYPGSLNLWVADAADADALCPAPETTEPVETIRTNWYRTVYDLVPAYPQHLLERAHHSYRSGDFQAARPTYLDVRTFLANSDYTDPVAAAEVERSLGNGDTGKDFFGFSPDAVEPTSPARGIDGSALFTTYSDHVRWFNGTILATDLATLTQEQFLGHLHEFRQQRQAIIRELSGEIETLRSEIVAEDLVIEGLAFDIGATIRSNGRRSELLASWARHVQAKIDEMTQPQSVCTECLAFETFWNGVKLVTSVVSMIYGYYQAAVSFVQATDELMQVADAYATIDQYEAQLAEADQDGRTAEAAILRGQIHNAGNQLSSERTQFSSAWNSFTSALNRATSATERASQLLSQLNTSTTGWTSADAVRFRDDVLLAENFGISGGLTYLVIREQIQHDQELLYSKITALRAAEHRRAALTGRLIFLVQEKSIRSAEAEYLDEMIELAEDGIADREAVRRELIRLGQPLLDALLMKFQEARIRMKYWNLSASAASTRYDRYIGNPVAIAQVLQEEQALRAEWTDWVNDNSNVGVVTLVVAANGPPPLATLPVGGANDLVVFQRGELVRPSWLLQIDPLILTRVVTQIAAVFEPHVADTGRLADAMAETFTREVAGQRTLLEVNELAPGTVFREITERELQTYPALRALLDSEVGDVELALLYSLAKAGVSTTTLGQLATEPRLPTVIRERMPRLRTAYEYVLPLLYERVVRSARVVSDSLRVLGPDAAARAQLLLDAFAPSITVAAYGLNDRDMDVEVIGSFDPDFPTDPILGATRANDKNVLLAVVLLHAGIDSAGVREIAAQLAAGSDLRVRLEELAMEALWDGRLRRSVLEREHRFGFSIDENLLYQAPNVSGTFKHRYLDATVEVTTADGVLPSVILAKTGENRWMVPDGSSRQGVEMEVSGAQRTVLTGPVQLPPGFVLEDYHRSALFGRAILGDWQISIKLKGNTRPLRDVGTVMIRFLYGSSSA